MEPFGIQVVIYLFLAGLAAGSGFWGSLNAASVGGRRAITLSLLCAMLGSIFLVFDLTLPQDFLLVVTQGNPGSAISWGARILTIFILAGIFVRVASRQGEALKGLDKVGLWIFRSMAIGLAIYPAFVLRQGEAFALWQQELILPLVVVSSFHAGLLLPVFLDQQRKLAPWEIKAEIALGGLQLLLLAILLLKTSGSIGAWIWALVVGTLVPLVFVFLKSERTLIPRVFLVLVGTFAMRHWLVIGGQG